MMETTHFHSSSITQKQSDKQLMLLLNHRKYSRCNRINRNPTIKEQNFISLIHEKKSRTRQWGPNTTEPACFFSVGVPLRWRISRSTRPRDMSPNVNPDIIPAKRTRKQENPAQINHQTSPKGMASLFRPEFRTSSIRAVITAFKVCIIVRTGGFDFPSDRSICEFHFPE